MNKDEVRPWDWEQILLGGVIALFYVLMFSTRPELAERNAGNG